MARSYNQSGNRVRSDVYQSGDPRARGRNLSEDSPLANAGFDVAADGLGLKDSDRNPNDPEGFVAKKRVLESMGALDSGVEDIQGEFANAHEQARRLREDINFRSDLKNGYEGDQPGSNPYYGTGKFAIIAKEMRDAAQRELYNNRNARIDAWDADRKYTDAMGDLNTKSVKSLLTIFTDPKLSFKDSVKAYQKWESDYRREFGRIANDTLARHPDTNTNSETYLKVVDYERYAARMMSAVLDGMDEVERREREEA